MVSVQHDLAFTAAGTIDFEAIVADMQDASFEMKYVVFSRFADTFAHDQLYKQTGFERIGTTNASVRANHFYSRTQTWSDNNHIAATLYLATLYDNCGAPFPEWCMMHAAKFPGEGFKRANEVERSRLVGTRRNTYVWSNFGTYWYASHQSSQQIFHIDGRRGATCHVAARARKAVHQNTLRLTPDGHVQIR
jgi:hypothetical protein